MIFKVINRDYAEIECRTSHSHWNGILFISVGGSMGVLCGVGLGLLPYFQPSFRSLIPFNFVLSVIFIIIALISIYIGNNYLKLTSFLAIDRKEGKITKFENRIFGSVEKKEVYGWEKIESVKADRYLNEVDLNEVDSRPWGGIIYFKIKNRKPVEALAGKGGRPDKIVESLLKFMKDPGEGEESEIYLAGFIIEE